jgi:hypothetical protein
VFGEVSNTERDFKSWANIWLHSRSHFKNTLGCGSLRYEIASSSGENVLAVSQRIHLRAFSPCILALP